MATTECTPEVHVDDIGTHFEISLKECDEILDVSSASAKQIIFKKPSGTILTKTAVFKTDGTDGIVKYVSIADDLDESGRWKMQAKITFPTGDSWSSEVTSFKVYTNLSA